MRTINDMYQEKGELIKQIRDVQDKCDDEKRDFSGDETTRVEKLEADLASLNTRIERESNLLLEEAQMRTREIEAEGSLRAAGDKKVETPESRYADNYLEFVRFGCENARAELRATTDPQTVGTNADGGFGVPDEWWAMFVEKRINANIMRQLATVNTSASGTTNVTKDDTAGVAEWVGENSTISVAKETIARVTLSAFKAARIMTVSAELLQDSIFDQQSFVLGRIARSIGILEEAAFVAGDNSGKPNGIFTAATTGVTAASATAITADELIDLFHSIIEEYRVDATWIMNDSTAKLIRKLKDGNQQYLWQPGLVLGQPDIIYGRPVRTSSNAPAATSGLDSILFGWIGAYWILDRKGLALQRLDELYAVNDLVGFKGTSRTDGELVDTDAVRVLTML